MSIGRLGEGERLADAWTKLKNGHKAGGGCVQRGCVQAQQSSWCVRRAIVAEVCVKERGMVASSTEEEHTRRNAGGRWTRRRAGQWQCPGSGGTPLMLLRLYCKRAQPRPAPRYGRQCKAHLAALGSSAVLAWHRCPRTGKASKQRQRRRQPSSSFHIPKTVAKCSSAAAPSMAACMHRQSGQQADGCHVLS
jgi:hypothetical protein